MEVDEGEEKVTKFFNFDLRRLCRHEAPVALLM